MVATPDQQLENTRDGGDRERALATQEGDSTLLVLHRQEGRGAVQQVARALGTRVALGHVAQEQMDAQRTEIGSDLGRDLALGNAVAGIHEPPIGVAKPQLERSLRRAHA